MSTAKFSFFFKSKVYLKYRYLNFTSKNNHQKEKFEERKKKAPKMGKFVFEMVNAIGFSYVIVSLKI